MLSIRVFSDYVCPFCFLGEVVMLRALAGREDQVNIEWLPFELRPYPTTTLRPEGDYLQQAWENSVYPMAAQLGIPITLPRVSPQPHTHLAFEGFQFAQAQGLADAYNHRMFTAFFQEEKDIGDITVLTDLAREIGLDPEAYRHSLENRTYRELHQKALLQARDLGISAVPTFVIGDRVYRGMLQQENFRQILESELGPAGH